MISGDVAEYQLRWEDTVFIPLEPRLKYRLRIRRPSDVLSFKAYYWFSINKGEVIRLKYQSPMLSFMAGTIHSLD